MIFAFRSFYAASFTTSELNESIAILILLFVNMTFTLQGSVYLTVLTGHEKYTFLRILSILMQVISAASPSKLPRCSCLTSVVPLASRPSAW